MPQPRATKECSPANLENKNVDFLDDPQLLIYIKCIRYEFYILNNKNDEEVSSINNYNESSSLIYRAAAHYPPPPPQPYHLLDHH